MNPRYIVIIGAARSGTKILRDSLAGATGIGKVPYDVSYVWRAGNERLPDDVIEPTEVSERTARFIRRFVDRYASGDPLAVIEKTVGNAMRLPAVLSVLPDATVIHLVRDGVDVIESIRRQWTAPSDLRYLVAKSRHFPPRLVPTYGVAFIRSAMRRRLAGDRRVGTWGLRYPGIDADLVGTDLLTVCARQWREAVVRTRADLAESGVRSLEVRYERLVEDPSRELERIADFAGLSIHRQALDATAATVRPDRQGGGRSSLTESELALLDHEVGGLLAELGYDPPIHAPTGDSASKD
jgi:hypothetical protein